MRKFWIALAVAAAVAGAFVAAFLASRDDGGVPPASDGGDRGEQVEIVEPPRVPDEPPPPPPAPAPGESPGPGTEPSPPSHAETVLAGIVVAQESGKPIAGARVSIAPDIPGRFNDRVIWLDIAETDAAGRFRFDGLHPALYRIQAAAPGRVHAGRTGVPLSPDPIEIALARGDAIRCRVLASGDDGDEPLADTVVFLEHPETGWSYEASTDAAGVLVVTGMTREDFERELNLIEVIVDGYADPFLQRSRDGETPYVILVDRGATVFGEVTDAATGKPIAGASVVSDQGHQVATDASGRYRLAGAEDGVMAFARGYAPVTHELDEFTDDPEYADPVRIDFSLGAGLILVGRVTDASGRPVAGVRVSIGADELDIDVDEERMEVRLRDLLSSVTGRDGMYRIAGLPADALDLPGFFELEVRPPGASLGIAEDVDVEVASGEVRHDIKLDLAGPVTGRVLDAGGAPLAGARVSVESVGEDTFQVTATDGAGRFELESLPVGDYALGVESEGRPVIVTRVTVPVAEPLELRVAPGRSVRGTVVSERTGEALEGMLVRVVLLRGSLSLVLEDRSGADGGFAIEAVPPGEHLLEIRRAPPQLIFNPLLPSYRVNVDLTDADWQGSIEYPVYPSGEVLFRFLVEHEGGETEEASAPATVSVVYYRRGRARSGSPGGRRAGIKVGEGTGVFEGRFREGEYIFQCVLDRGGRKLVQNVNVSITDGGATQHDVVFRER